jgi:DNA-binding beta-propeller fold protein YncE
MFKRNKNTGSLTPAGCIADPINNPDSCTKTAAGLDNAIGVAVSADNKSVYATGHDDNSVVNFKRNTTTGKLTPVVCFADPANNPDSCADTASGLDGAEDVAVSADGKSVVAAGLLDNAIVAFKRTP